MAIILFVPLCIIQQGGFAQKVKNSVLKIETKDTLFAWCDEIPAKFSNGMNGWLKYFDQNLRYPPSAAVKGLQAVVKVKMTVDTDGHVSHVKALNNLGNGFAKEAERVVRESPNWIPATLHNKSMVYCFVQTITFSMQ